MLMHFVLNMIEETTLAKNKLKGFQTFRSNPVPSSVEIDTYKTEMVDFIHTISGNKGGKKCVAKQWHYTLHEIKPVSKIEKITIVPHVTAMYVLREVDPKHLETFELKPTEHVVHHGWCPRHLGRSCPICMLAQPAANNWLLAILSHV